MYINTITTSRRQVVKYMSIDYVNRFEVRIVALSKAVPIMTLPAEIRAIIYSQLSPFDQFKVNINLSSRLVFNPYDVYEIHCKCYTIFTMLLYMYSESRLFDKVFPALYSEYDITKDWPMQNLYKFATFNRLHNDEPYSVSTNYKFMLQIYSHGVLDIYKSSEYKDVPIKAYVIFIKFCLIVLKRDRDDKHKYNSEHIYNEYWCVNNVYEPANENQNSVWKIYKHIHRTITIILLSCINNSESTTESTEALYNILTEYYINDNNRNMAILLTHLVNSSDYGYYEHVRYYRNVADTTEMEIRNNHLSRMHINYIKRVEILSNLESNNTISASEFVMYILKNIKDGTITEFINSGLEWVLHDQGVYFNTSEITPYTELYKHPDVMSLKGFILNCGNTYDDSENEELQSNVDGE